MAEQKAAAGPPATGRGGAAPGQSSESSGPGEPRGRPPGARPAASLALLVASALLAVGASELAFRGYERVFQTPHAALGDGDLDLRALGFNDHEGVLRVAPEAGALRVLSFGDSFAEAVTRPEYSYAAVLQRELARARGGPVRVANLGRAATTLPHYLREARRFGARAAPDAVLFGIYAGNDLLDVPLSVGDPAQPPAEAAAGDRVPHRFPLRMLDFAWAHYLSLRHRADDAEPDAERYRPGRFQAEPERYARMQAAYADAFRLDRLGAHLPGMFWLRALLREARALREGGLQVAVSVAPPHFAVSETWLERVLEIEKLPHGELVPDLPEVLVGELARRVGFDGPVIALTACLREAAARGEALYYGTNTHWSVAGNERVGRLLAGALAPRWLRRDAATAERPSCDTAPRPASPELRRLVDRGLEASDVLERLPLVQLAARRFASREAAAHALRELGLTWAPTRVRGQLTGVARDGFGLPVLDVGGWAEDREAPDATPALLFFARGRLRGVGAPLAPGRRPGAFDARVTGAAPDDLRRGRLFGFAISPDGAFGPLLPSPRLGGRGGGSV